ncbi:MAG: hypothetical protein MK108_05920 [Mariniblastus sp.]|nr:hypothetical protein [Mariniblastus sp.]
MQPNLTPTLIPGHLDPLRRQVRRTNRLNPMFAVAYFCLFAVSVLLVVNAPESNTISRAYCAVILVTVGLILGLVFLRKLTEPKPVNWLTPETAFTASYVVVHFLYILLWLTGVYDLGDEIWYWRQADCPDVVCKTLAMCTACLAAFHCGFCMLRCRLPVTNDYRPSTLSGWQRLGKVMTRTSLVLLAVFVALIGSAFLGGNYSGSSFGFLPNVVFLIFQGLIIASVTVMVLSRASIRSTTRKLMALDLALVLLGAFALLLHGDRSLFLVIIVTVVAAISEFVKPIKLQTGVLAVIGLFMLFGVSQIARTADDRSIFAFYDAGRENWDKSFELSARTFGASGLCAFVAVDWAPERHDYYWGQLKTNDLAGLVPFGRKLFGVTQSPDTSSSHLFTFLIQGSTRRVSGCGSSVFGDIYLEVGFWGACLFFMLLGLFYRFVTEKSRSSRNLLWKVAFIALIAVSAICGRYGITSLLIRHVGYPVIYTAFFAFILGVKLVGRPGNSVSAVRY